MKRTLTALLLAAVSLNVGAQTWQDAYVFSENNYVGTARSVGMGNAMTAVGGDLGSLVFNPAGSAVAGYSTFAITPSVTISNVFAQGTTLSGETVPYGFEDGLKSRMPRFKMPNFGFVMSYDTHSSSLRRVTFGLVGHATNDFTSKIAASGTNFDTSVAGSLASQADGYPVSIMDGGYYQDDIPSWETMVGYKAGIISPMAGRENAYIGVTERLLSNGKVQLADQIKQRYGQQRVGNKYDLLMNFAMDFSDRFYLGANIGITSLSYRSDQVRAEEPADGTNITVNYEGQNVAFNSLRIRSAYQAEGSGIYAKIGFLARPFGGLRIGAAIQTPTIMEIRENYALDAQTVLSGSSRTAQTPEDEWYYNLVSPYRVNAGIAYTFGKLGLVSVDYELCDYSTMSFRSSNYNEFLTDFGGVNGDIAQMMTMSHALRAGVELKPLPEMAIRVGYNFETNPVVGLTTPKQRVSFGLGYDSNGSFFADAAVRLHYLQDEYLIPYYYYDWDDQGTFIDDTVLTPEIGIKTTMVDAMLTLGWRF